MDRRLGWVGETADGVLSCNQMLDNAGATWLRLKFAAPDGLIVHFDARLRRPDGEKGITNMLGAARFEGILTLPCYARCRATVWIINAR